MRIIAETDAEALLLAARLPAVSTALGPLCDLTAQLPSGKILPKPLRGTPAAQAATLSERMDEMIRKNGW
jgi:hypothetical protein